MERYKVKCLINCISSVAGFIFPTILSIFILLIVGCGTTREKPVGSEINLDKTTFFSKQNAYPFDLFPDYRIVPGDVLDVLFQIRTWIETEEFRLAIDHEISVKFIYSPELNETQRVRPDGKISLPYIGEIRVIGKTVSELSKELKDRYAKILKNPELYILVPDFRSRIQELKRDLHTAPRGLSRLVTVRPDGYVTFPMLGDVFVAHKTIPDVSKIMNEMYDKILPGLHVDLFLERHSGSLIYVAGQISKPGAYSIIKPISILEALALAGSYLPGAELNNVIVIRKHGSKLVATRVNVLDVLDLKSRSQLFYLQPDDIVYVPRTRIVKIAEIMRNIADILMFRGWGLGLGWDLHSEEPE